MSKWNFEEFQEYYRPMPPQDLIRKLIQMRKEEDLHLLALPSISVQCGSHFLTGRAHRIDNTNGESWLTLLSDDGRNGQSVTVVNLASITALSLDIQTQDQADLLLGKRNGILDEPELSPLEFKRQTTALTEALKNQFKQIQSVTFDGPDWEKSSGARNRGLKVLEKLPTVLKKISMDDFGKDAVQGIQSVKFAANQKDQLNCQVSDQILAFEVGSQSSLSEFLVGNLTTVVTQAFK